MEAYLIARWTAAFLLLAAMAWMGWASRAHRSSPARSPLGRIRAAWAVGPEVLRCRQSIRLTQQHTLHVVECGSRQLILACHPAGATVLGDAAAEPAATGEKEVHAKASAVA